MSADAEADAILPMGVAIAASLSTYKRLAPTALRQHHQSTDDKQRPIQQ